MAGILSGPKALEDFRFLVAALSSGMVKEDVSIGRVSETGTVGRVQFSGTFALLPRRFSKWLDQFSRRFLADPPLILTEEPVFLPDRSLMVFQARWCCLLICSLDSLSILPLMKSTSALRYASSRFFLAVIN